MMKLNITTFFSKIRLNSRIISYNHSNLSSASGSVNHSTENESSTKLKQDLCDIKEHYDIIIAGGGLVGTTLACALAKNKTLSKKKVLLLEGAPVFNGFNSGDYGNRVSALNHGTKRLMQEIDAWELIKRRFKPVKQMQVWDASSDALITFNHDNFADDVAYIVENDLILDSVYKQLKSHENVEIRNLSKIEKVGLPRDGYKNSVVGLKDNENYSCELLIGADGFNSLVRKQMGVNNYTENYNQMGLVATLELCQVDNNSVAWQRFLPTGPVALLPLNEKQSSLVWSTTPDHVKELTQMNPDEFVECLNEAFIKEYPKDNLVNNALNFIGSFMGNVSHGMKQLPPRVKSVQHKSRACFPLGFGHATSYVTQGAAIIGDAAHRVHPLAGQGVNLGFGDVQSLVNVLNAACYSGAKLGDNHHLLKYEKDRLMKNVPIILGIHGLQNLYGTDFTPIVLLRSLGLQITQNVPPLKKLFMDRAMG